MSKIILMTPSMLEAQIIAPLNKVSHKGINNSVRINIVKKFNLLLIPNFRHSTKYCPVKNEAEANENPLIVKAKEMKVIIQSSKGVAKSSVQNIKDKIDK
jgi:hypothetical protein